MTYPTLQTLIEKLSLDGFVTDCHRRTRLAEDALKDATLEILAAMLAQRQKFDGCFENELAFHAYLRKSVLRRALSQHAREHQKEDELKHQWFTEASKTPEDQLIQALETRRFSEIVEQVIKHTKDADDLLKEGREIIDLVMSAPDQYVQKRMSGDNKGNLVFNYIGLARALGWNKQRVYDRVQRIRRLLLKEIQKRERAR